MTERRKPRARLARPPSEAAVDESPPSKRLRESTSPFKTNAVIAGRYVIRSNIGVGGMGAVYSATELATGLEVAIKAVNATAFTPENLRRFRREAQTATSIKNKYLCAVHYLGVAEGTPFIVMERLFGETLSRRVRDAGPTSPSDAVTIMMQLLEGLSAAHAAGIIHRDVKPANIFITTPRGDSPVIKVIDFGLAKLVANVGWKPRPESPPEELSAITATDVIPGTPFYLAPEQIRGLRDLDERVDVWAAGVTLYEMLVGHRAYDAPSYAALATTILRKVLPPLSSLRPDVPVGFDAVLHKAVAKDRDARFPTAAAFRAALIAEWARFRTAGVARAKNHRNFRPEARTLPIVEIEPASPDDMTEIDVHIEFEPDDADDD